MKNQPLYKSISSAISALKNSEEKTSIVWVRNWKDYLGRLNNLLPSGSGLDAGCEIDTSNSTPERIVILLSYHGMDENGGYVGWTEHKVIITPSLHFDINLRITGSDKFMIKDYLHDIMHDCLTEFCDTEDLFAQAIA
jgi:hypothetical protein